MIACPIVVFITVKQIRMTDKTENSSSYKPRPKGIHSLGQVIHKKKKTTINNLFSKYFTQLGSHALSLRIFTFHKQIPFDRWNVISNTTGTWFGLVEAEKRKGA